MRTPVYSGQFKRDLNLARKRGKDLEKIKELMRLLIDEKPLSPRYRDHPLRGQWRSLREAHIEPDWLLIYKAEHEEVRFERTGRHTDLFDE